jgi:hypothetical protein
MAKRTLDALIYAEKRKAVGGSESEFRHLEIPALYFAAVWLHAKDGDLIIPILKGFQPIEKFETISGENFFQYLLKNFSDVVNRA